VRYDIKSTGGVTQSSVFIIVLLAVIVLLVGAVIAIAVAQHKIKQRYELR